MRALLVHRYGERLQYDESAIERPPPLSNNNDPNLLIVKVEYAGVNPVDYKIRKGNLKVVLTLPFPAVLGLDYSGTLVDKHPKSTCPIPVGSKVFGKLSSGTTSGTYGEFIRLKWQHDLISPVPEGFPMDQAAGMGVAALTAAVGLVDYIGAEVPSSLWDSTKQQEPTKQPPSQQTKQLKVLIIGASGGVGHYAVQLTRALGTVYSIAVCSTRNVDYVRGLGADQVIDYTRGPLSQQLTAMGYSGAASGAGEKLDAVLDLVGGDEYYTELKGFIKRGGQFVTAAGPIAGGDVQLTVQAVFGMVWRLVSRRLASLVGLGVSYSFISDLPAKHWPLICRLMEQGQLHTTLHAVIPVKSGAEAHDLIETGRTVGKIVIKF
jgi:NADPH:quinone reductase-like Zn-dependent oxidoreductase